MNEDEKTYLSWIALKNASAQLRAIRRATGDYPNFGVFYYVNDRIYANPEPTQGAHKGGDFLYTRVDHYGYWHNLVGNIPGLGPVAAQLAEYFTAFPRGRVVFNWKTNTPKVFICPEIPKSAYPQVISAFGLQKYAKSLVFDLSDEHYIRQEDDIEALEFIMEMKGIKGIKSRYGRKLAFKQSGLTGMPLVTSRIEQAKRDRKEQGTV